MYIDDTLFCWAKTEKWLIPHHTELKSVFGQAAFSTAQSSLPERGYLFWHEFVVPVSHYFCSIIY